MEVFATHIFVEVSDMLDEADIQDKPMFLVPVVELMGFIQQNLLWDTQSRLCLTQSFPSHIMHFFLTCFKYSFSWDEERTSLITLLILVGSAVSYTRRGHIPFRGLWKSRCDPGGDHDLTSTGWLWYYYRETVWAWYSSAYCSWFSGILSFLLSTEHFA